MFNWRELLGLKPTVASFAQALIDRARARGDHLWRFDPEHLVIRHDEDGTINLAILKFVTDEAAGVERGMGFRGLHHIGFEVDDVEGTAQRVEAAGANARTDIDEALGIPHDGPIKGEFKYEGPDGVVFDLSQPGVWQLS